MGPKILILAGGGGHTGYSFALAQALEGRASLSFLVPDGDILSKKRLSKYGKVDFLTKPRGPKTSNTEFAIRIAKAFAESLGKIPRNLDAVVSSGSNFCISPSVIAWAKGTVLVNIESSVRFVAASKTTRILKLFSALTAVQWEEQKKLLDGSVVVGPLLPKPEVEPWDGGYILVTGGTYGHRLLFDTINRSDLKNVILQTGLIDPTQYAKNHPKWKILTLTDTFHELLAGARIVITHFGSTILDAFAYRKPTVIVLNPEWTRTAGAEDAKMLGNKLKAILVTEINLENILSALDKATKTEVPKIRGGAENLASRIIEILNADQPNSVASSKNHI